MTLALINRLSSASQELLRATSPGLVVDGIIGPLTLKAFDLSTSHIQQNIEAILTQAGLPGKLSQVAALRRMLLMAVSKAMTFYSNDFSAEAALFLSKAGLKHPEYFLGQLLLESGGRSGYNATDGKPAFNYAGLKLASVPTSRHAEVLTYEYIRGTRVRVLQKFAAFDSVGDFVSHYLAYLLKGPSSYRYPGLSLAETPLDFAGILKRGGYATDPDYQSKLVSVINRL